MSELTLSVLLENSAESGLIAEHGLSIHLRYRGHALLLDAGDSGVFAVNAERMGVDLSAVELAALSHGHFDHADGFATFFALNSTAPILARTAITAPEYHGKRYIGVNPALLARFSSRFDLSDAPRQPMEGVWLLPDAVAHEQSLVLETEKGLVVLNSCCHAGAAEVAASVLRFFPNQTIRALIGGFHLMGEGGPSTLGAAPEELRALGDRLFSELGVGSVWTGHCTGTPAFALLHDAFPNRVHPLTTGLLLSF